MQNTKHEKLINSANMRYATREISFKAYCDGLSQLGKNIWLYHEKNWLDLISKGIGYNIIILETRASKKVVVYTPIFIKKILFLTLAGSPLRGSYTEFLGPIILGEDNDLDINEIFISQHNYLIKKGASYIEWRFKSSEQLINYSMLPGGYIREKCFSQLIDTSRGKDYVWGEMQGRARNIIRKAEKNNITVEINSFITESDMHEYYSLLEETFKRQGLKNPHGWKFYRCLAESLTSKGNIKYFFVKMNDLVISGAIFLLMNERMMYFSGTSTQEGNKLGASSAIQWEAIKYACQNGIKEYDMGGLGVESIDKFKKSFGGDEISHWRFTYKTSMVSYLEKLFKTQIKVKAKIRLLLHAK